MGYVFAMGTCCACGNAFSFNPHRVPSFTLNGTREPICRACVDMINDLRVKKGVPPFTIMPDAYEPIDEREL